MILHLLVLITALVGTYFRILARIERYHAENQRRYAVLESKVDDLWEHFIQGRGPGWRRGSSE